MPFEIISIDGKCFLWQIVEIMALTLNDGKFVNGQFSSQQRIEKSNCVVFRLFSRNLTFWSFEEIVLDESENDKCFHFFRQNSFICFLFQIFHSEACHQQTTSFKRASCVTSETDLNEDYAKKAKK